MGTEKLVSESPPLTHVVPVMEISSKGREVNIVATEQELTNIADALSLVLVSSLSAHFLISKGTGGLLSVRGHLNANVVQTCGVSLKPVEEHIDTDIALCFTLHPETESDEISIKVEDDDPPDPIVDGCIEFGGIILEHLILNLNPYPRDPNMEFDRKRFKTFGSEADSASSRPFLALTQLQRTKK